MFLLTDMTETDNTHFGPSYLSCKYVVEALLRIVDQTVGGKSSDSS